MSSRNERRFELRLGKRGLVLLAAGLSILLFASFWVGLEMGRNMETPTIQISRVSPLAAADRTGVPSPGPVGGAGTSAGAGKAAAPGVVPAQPASSSGQPPAPPSQSIATNKAAAPAASPELQAKRPAPPPADRDVKTTPARQEATGGKPASVAAAAVPSSQAKAIADAPPKKAEEPDKKKETYNLQVASYRDRAKANETAKKLSSLGFKPRVLAVDLPTKGRWYRIVLGGFKSRDEAQKAADKIAKKIKGTSCIIRKA